MPLFPFALQGVDWSSDTIKASLVKSTWVYDGTETVWSDISSHECSGSGYAALTLSSKTEAITNNRQVFDAADLSWTTINVTDVAYLVIYKDSGRLLSWYDVKDAGSPRTLINANATIQWHSTDGLFIVRYE